MMRANIRMQKMVPVRHPMDSSVPHNEKQLSMRAPIPMMKQTKVMKVIHLIGDTLEVANFPSF